MRKRWNMCLSTKASSTTPEQYENIIIRANEEGEMIRLQDIADVELGSEFFDIYSNLDGKPSASIVLKQTLGSNASEVIATGEGEARGTRTRSCRRASTTR